jgi:hypothetical protein
MIVLFPLTGTITLMGVAAILYGLATLTPMIFLEGLFLFFLGFRLTILAIGD